MIYATVFWLFVVTAPNGVEVTVREYPSREECTAAQEAHDRMGLSEYKAVCRERHRVTLPAPRY